MGAEEWDPEWVARRGNRIVGITVLVAALSLAALFGLFVLGWVLWGPPADLD